MHTMNLWDKGWMSEGLMRNKYQELEHQLKQPITEKAYRIVLNVYMLLTNLCHSSYRVR